MLRKILSTFLIILFISCVPQREILKQQDINRETILEWQKRNEFLKNFKARAKVYISTSDDARRFSAIYIASLPMSFRLEVLSPFGQTIAGISSDGEKIYALNLNENICYRAPLNELNLNKFLPFNVAPQVLVNFLITRIPFFEDSNITINSVTNKQIEVSVVNRDETVCFDSRDEFMVTGELNGLSFNFERFFKSDKILVPSKISLKEELTTVIMEIENPIINTHVEQDDFILKFPEDCIFEERNIFL